MKTVFCIGELLIDWISTDINNSLITSTNFIKKAGGAPANVTIAAARLGGNASFAGKVGKDPFGLFLKETLDKENVNTQNLILADQYTTFAYVSIKKDGERDFIFMRGADELLQKTEIKLPTENTLYHFGSATGFLGGKLTETYYSALEHALKENLFISFDPNFRDALWANTATFIEHSLYFMAQADFIKLSEEEALLISKKTDLQEALKTFPLKENAIVCITLGKKGTLLYYHNSYDIIPSIIVKAIDTTGAGDAFVGAMLKQFADDIPQNFTEIKKYVSFANKVAAISTTEYGAIEALPTFEKLSTIF